MNIISTHGLSINIAKQYLNKNLWIALGGASISWVDNENPPMPSLSLNKFNDLIGLLYIDIKRLVAKDPTGSIKTGDSSYRYANPLWTTEKLITEQAYYLYLEGTVEPFSSLEGQKVKLIGLAENVIFDTDPVLRKYSFVPTDNVIDYDLTLVATVPELVIASERKFQFVRRF